MELAPNAMDTLESSNDVGSTNHQSSVSLPNDTLLDGNVETIAQANHRHQEVLGDRQEKGRQV